MNLNTLVPKLQNTNITKYLISNGFSKTHASEISYAVQTGTYEKITMDNFKNFQHIANKRAELLNAYMTDECTLLDCGCGELTTLSLETIHLKPCKIYAFDISLNRILHGVGFYKKHGSSSIKFHPFCADMGNIPLPDSCIDVVKTVHSIEPNGGNETQIIKELFRVSKKYVILFEPCYEEETPKFKKHMDSHGYAKNLREEIVKNGGTIMEDFVFHNNYEDNSAGVPAPNTHCFIVHVSKEKTSVPGFICPITTEKLKESDSYMYGGGYIYNKIHDIPVLRQKNGIVFIDQ